MYEPESVKVVLLGESGVGKTSIINQFTIKKFNPRCPSSVSAQFTSKIIDYPQFEKSIKFDIWDTVGQEKYRSLARIFYNNAKVILFVYDITKEHSFNSLKDFWYKETLNNTDETAILGIVANKVDLYEDQTVDNNVGKAFAEQINAIFQTTSALNDSGINTLFDNIAKKIIIPEYDYKNMDTQIQKDYMEKAGEIKKEKNITLEKKNSDQINEGSKNKCC